MRVLTRLERLKMAVDVYKHDAKVSKNEHRIADYKAIKNLYDGLSHFCDDTQRSCGAIFPFLEIAFSRDCDDDLPF